MCMGWSQGPFFCILWAVDIKMLGKQRIVSNHRRQDLVPLYVNSELFCTILQRAHNIFLRRLSTTHPAHSARNSLCVKWQGGQLQQHASVLPTR